MINDLDRLTDKFRGTGRSTEQIKNAPYKSLYICPSNILTKYFENAAYDLGRKDLYFSGPEGFKETITGFVKSGFVNDIIVDHGAVDKLDFEAMRICVEMKNILKEKRK